MTSSDLSPSPDPSLIVDLAVAYRGTMMLFAANELNLFTTLSEDPRIVAQLAEASGAESRPLEAVWHWGSSGGTETGIATRRTPRPFWSVDTRPTSGTG